MQVRVETVSAPILDSPDTLIYFFCRKQSFATVERRSGVTVDSNACEAVHCIHAHENYLYHFVIALE
jgi:hypothetical protein